MCNSLTKCYHYDIKKDVGGKVSTQYQYKVIWCPICDQGWVEIMKDIGNKKLVLSCSECEWENPEDIVVSYEEEEGCENIGSPTDEEIKRFGWEKYIINFLHYWTIC